MSQVFAGIRVVDLTQGMAGPLATMILADYGADVIRLEPPGGDPMWEHPAYLLWQRGKKSVALDWSREDGRAKARQLMQSADVFIESLRPGEAAALSLDYDAVKSVNPALIYYSLSSFGQEGPSRYLKAYDGIVNAKSGRMRDQVGWQKNRPTFRAVNDISYHSAMFALQAIIAALRVRQMTGRGQKLEGTLLSGVTAPNNAWRRFDGRHLPPDLYPGELPKEAVARGELVADRHESDPYTAIPSQLCARVQGRPLDHALAYPAGSVRLLDRCDRVQLDTRGSALPQRAEIRQPCGPHCAESDDLRAPEGKDFARMARDLSPESRLRRRDHADHARGAPPRAIYREWPLDRDQ